MLQAGVWLILLSSILPAAETARLVILGTGTPIPDPQRSGPSVAIVASGRAYLFDAGPGVVRRAAAAAEQLRISALAPYNLTKLFLTHLHSDHTLGYPDLIFTPWVTGRAEPLDVYGPEGTKQMTQHLKSAYAEDIAIRTEGLEHLDAHGLQVRVHEIAAGQVYQDANITVRAIPVKHGTWPQAFGYAVDAGGRKFVISGDTTPVAEIAEACRGCDVLVHEVYSATGFSQLPPETAPYHPNFHTSTKELAELASRAKPKLLVLYHQLYFGRTDWDLEAEVRQNYGGAVVSARDLAVY